MAHMLGMQYVRVDVQKTVDVAAVVRAVREVVEERLMWARDWWKEGSVPATRRVEALGIPAPVIHVVCLRVA
ncbi:hypothetical protein C8F04DRAFT_1276285 [Mycena alexandri]|uniref:Uncharacterized protein n=1 Tax=Mycena alexandri TaxID=1745969 RepID=A0AAD6S5N3_9AGAR|nr:hypothetical protein C8F04DRAFT_1276285 [Mycena alexandri]